jgi:hypothetical protein
MSHLWANPEIAELLAVEAENAKPPQRVSACPTAKGGEK